jgi:NUMOD3 motif
VTSREGQLVTDQSHNPPEISSGEAQLTALMALDAAVQRARASGEDEPRKSDRRRRPPSAETRAKLSKAAKAFKRAPLSEEARAKIAAAMRGNANRKRNHTAVPRRQPGGK